MSLGERALSTEPQVPDSIGQGCLRLGRGYACCSDVVQQDPALVGVPTIAYLTGKGFDVALHLSVHVYCTSAVADRETRHIVRCFLGPTKATGLRLFSDPRQGLWRGT